MVHLKDQQLDMNLKNIDELKIMYDYIYVR